MKKLYDLSVVSGIDVHFSWKLLGELIKYPIKLKLMILEIICFGIVERLFQKSDIISWHPDFQLKKDYFGILRLN